MIGELLLRYSNANTHTHQLSILTRGSIARWADLAFKVHRRRTNKVAFIVSLLHGGRRFVPHYWYKSIRLMNPSMFVRFSRASPPAVAGVSDQDVSRMSPQQYDVRGSKTIAV